MEKTAFKLGIFRDLFFVRMDRVRIHIPLIALVVSFSLIVYLIVITNDLPNYFSLVLYHRFLFFSLQIVPCLILFFYLIRLAIKREKSPLRRLAHFFRQHILNGTNIVEVGIPLLLLPAFLSSLTSFKSVFPNLNPFYLDEALAKFDASLFGGSQPWELSHSLVSSADGTFIVAMLYFSWFFMMWSFFVWQTLRLHCPAERQQFLIAFVLCWTLLGSLAAALLSSAGPCFYGAVTGLEDIYAPLLERLVVINDELVLHDDVRRIGLGALHAQSGLWESYSTGKMEFASGISAMPSLHVAITTLCALSAWQINRTFGCFMIIYTAVIVFGSVHLAWHYAADAIFAIIGTILIWYFSGKFATYICKGVSVSTSRSRPIC